MSQYTTPIKHQGQDYKFVIGLDRRLEEVFFQLFTPEDDGPPSYSSLYGMTMEDAFEEAFGQPLSALRSCLAPALDALGAEMRSYFEPAQAALQGIAPVEPNTCKTFSQVELPALSH